MKKNFLLFMITLMLFCGKCKASDYANKSLIIDNQNQKNLWMKFGTLLLRVLQSQEVPENLFGEIDLNAIRELDAYFRLHPEAKNELLGQNQTASLWMSTSTFLEAIESRAKATHHNNTKRVAMKMLAFFREQEAIKKFQTKHDLAEYLQNNPLIYCMFQVIILSEVIAKNLFSENGYKKQEKRTSNKPKNIIPFQQQKIPLPAQIPVIKKNVVQQTNKIQNAPTQQNTTIIFEQNRPKPPHPENKKQEPKSIDLQKEKPRSAEEKSDQKKEKNKNFNKRKPFLKDHQ